MQQAIGKGVQSGFSFRRYIAGALAFALALVVGFGVQWVHTAGSFLGVLKPSAQNRVSTENQRISYAIGVLGTPRAQADAIWTLGIDECGCGCCGGCGL